MNVLDEILTLLAKMLCEPSTRKATIKEYQSLIWDGATTCITKDMHEILAELAYDLNFFEDDPILRREDPHYYGNERLEEEVNTALTRLADLGINVVRNRSNPTD